ncbi:MAG TPA: hypothetical protein VGP16_19295 [Asanoa sp.]|nr:hypothetical protein [Asanoa sp.]
MAPLVAATAIIASVAMTGPDNDRALAPTAHSAAAAASIRAVGLPAVAP